MLKRFAVCPMAMLFCLSQFATAEVVSTVEALVSAVNEGEEGAKIEIAAGTYQLKAPLEPKSGMSLIGAGMDETIITHIEGWKPSVVTLPDHEMRTQVMDTYAYIIRLQDKAEKVVISNLTLKGPQMHGAVFAFAPVDLNIHHVRVQDT